MVMAVLFARPRTSPSRKPRDWQLIKRTFLDIVAISVGSKVGKERC
jgi:hypothetical protein